MPNLTEELDRLIDDLDRRIESDPAAADAIDLILAAQPWETRVRSLRNDASVEAFRRELMDGFIRVDTVNGLLSLVHTVITSLMTR